MAVGFHRGFLDRTRQQWTINLPLLYFNTFESCWTPQNLGIHGVTGFDNMLIQQRHCHANCTSKPSGWSTKTICTLGLAGRLWAGTVGQLIVCCTEESLSMVHTVLCLCFSSQCSNGGVERPKPEIARDCVSSVCSPKTSCR